MVAPAGTIRATWAFTGSNGGTADVVMHFRTRDTHTADTTELFAFAIGLAGWFTTDNFRGATNLAMYKHLNEHTTCVELRCQTLTATPIGVDVGIAQAGVNTGFPLPPETAIVTTWRTGFLGRRYRGRSFWPGCDPDELETTGLLQAGQQVSWHTTAAALVAGYAADTDWQFVVYSVTGAVTTEVISVTVQPVPHHQRRRNN